MNIARCAWGGADRKGLRAGPRWRPTPLCRPAGLGDRPAEFNYVVDGGKARIILSAFVTPADGMQNQAMVDLIQRARFRWKLPLRRAVGDTAYGTAETIAALETQGIRVYTPLPDWEARTPFYGSSHFSYDDTPDVYRCPADQVLRRRKTKYTEGVVVYQADAAICNACSLQAACAKSRHGRQVRRLFQAEYLDQVRARHQTVRYPKLMRKRYDVPSDEDDARPGKLKMMHSPHMIGI